MENVEFVITVVGTREFYMWSFDGEVIFGTFMFFDTPTPKVIIWLLLAQQWFIFKYTNNELIINFILYFNKYYPFGCKKNVSYLQTTRLSLLSTTESYILS